jgi:shikimate kinase
VAGNSRAYDTEAVAVTAADPLSSGIGRALSSGLPGRLALSCIVLTGFMGAGKSTVGALLAARLGWRFLDVDQEIERVQGLTVAEIFSLRGEAWFRQVERETIQSLLRSDALVLALGGGAIEDEITRQLILNPEPAVSGQTKLIHLEAALETVLDRCRGTEELRPVLRDRVNLETRYARRLPLYRQAHYSVPVDLLTPDAVVEAILEQIGIQS